MIRRAQATDASAIAAVHVQSWEETYRGKAPDASLDERTVDVRKKQWQRILANERVECFVSEDDSGVHGFAMAVMDAREPQCQALLDTLYVLKSHHKRGIARELLSAIAGALAPRGVQRMWWLTLRDENPARAFYERVGAELVREQPAPPELGPGVMDCVYRIKLASLLPEAYFQP